MKPSSTFLRQCLLASQRLVPSNVPRKPAPSHPPTAAKRALPRLTNLSMISLLVGHLTQRRMQKKQFMLLFSRLASPGVSPVGKRIPTQSNALATKTRMTTPSTASFEFMLPVPITMIGKSEHLGHTPVLHKRIEASHVENKLSRMSFPVILRPLQPSLRQSQSQSRPASVFNRVTSSRICNHGAPNKRLLKPPKAVPRGNQN